MALKVSQLNFLNTLTGSENSVGAAFWLGSGVNYAEVVDDVIGRNCLVLKGVGGERQSFC